MSIKKFAACIDVDSSRPAPKEPEADRDAQFKPQVRNGEVGRCTSTRSRTISSMTVCHLAVARNWGVL